MKIEAAKEHTLSLEKFIHAARQNPAAKQVIMPFLDIAEKIIARSNI
jgi:hypothetical protein